MLFDRVALMSMRWTGTSVGILPLLALLGCSEVAIEQLPDVGSLHAVDASAQPTMDASSATDAASPPGADTGPGLDAHTPAGADAGPVADVGLRADSGSPALDSGSPAGPDATVSADAATPAGDAACDPTSVALKLAGYKAAFDAVYTAYSGEFDTLVASGDGETYYTFSYVLDGTISMYLGTKDETYLARALAWSETMLAKATIVDSNGDRNWSGPWASPYSATMISYHLDDLQGSAPLARLVKVIKTSPALDALYGARANAILAFLKTDIVAKWADHRSAASWYHDNAYDKTVPYNDKIALDLKILTDVYQIDGSYQSTIDDLATALKQRLAPIGTNGALIWDNGVGYDGMTTWDTSHANRHPYVMFEVLKSGRIFSSSDLAGVERLLTTVIWNGSVTDPRFTNFIDGTNVTYLGRGPWGLGQIYSGWISLANVDATVFRAGDASLTAVLGKVSNPSVDYMNTEFGKTELAGHLAEALAAGNVCP
jgi:hypothetical protein